MFSDIDPVDGSMIASNIMLRYQLAVCCSKKPPLDRDIDEKSNSIDGAKRNHFCIDISYFLQISSYM